MKKQSPYFCLDQMAKTLGVSSILVADISYISVGGKWAQYTSYLTNVNRF